MIIIGIVLAAALAVHILAVVAARKAEREADNKSKAFKADLHDP